jgi:hypothetical protein
MHEFRIEIDIEPVQGFNDPRVRYGISGLDTSELTIDKPKTLVHKQSLPAGSYTFEIELINKHRNDPTMAVIVNNIRVMDIEDYQFIYNSVYNPVDREPLTAHNYICWPGPWQMHFTSPVYTWIHKQLDLGWIYD